MTVLASVVMNTSAGMPGRSSTSGGVVGDTGLLVGHAVGGEGDHLAVERLQVALGIGGQVDAGGLAQGHRVDVGDGDLGLDEEGVVQGHDVEDRLAG